ncbi:PRC-barrel domain-containing protein [Kineococcus rhizosphaerae]|uniref:Sporulation protein YlmC with PRC-barrel domain n=1 Tax=Kineococcus rhizosphaerae TaxID=559628 RepID=A0A2T0QWX1_9ACTN|nr:PRC-barrel domain-containing protein [Kineococcus rhizosphaerae]PRY10060.1 sporulation protein YlmC with PRC-barrel domain [Kineococcus rhizosphaerae]
MSDERARILTGLSDSGRTVADPAQDVRGLTVRDTSGEELGKVADLMVDAEADQVRMLRIEHGGLLGIGAETLLLPVEAVVTIADDEVIVDQTRDRVASAPAYEPELADQTGYYDNLYGYYGYTPYWAPGAGGQPWFPPRP